MNMRKIKTAQQSKSDTLMNMLKIKNTRARKARRCTDGNAEDDEVGDQREHQQRTRTKISKITIKVERHRRSRPDMPTKANEVQRDQIKPERSTRFNKTVSIIPCCQGLINTPPAKCGIQRQNNSSDHNAAQKQRESSDFACPGYRARRCHTPKARCQNPNGQPCRLSLIMT